MTTTVDFTARLKALHELRMERDASLSRLAAIRAEFDLTYTASIGEAADLKARVDGLELALRADALLHYMETGEAKAAPGLEVKQFTKLTYEDADAFAWAQEHKVALKLDTKTFEKVAAASPLPFVTISKESRAQISTDLAKVL